MKAWLVLLASLAGSAAWADISFDPVKNLIVVENFAESAPCTVKALRLTDRLNEWGMATYDAETDVTTVNANLQIGKLDGEASYFQIGTEDNPKETLVLNGNLVVCPACVHGVSKRIRENGLLIGSPADPKVGGTLRLGKEKAFYIGFMEAYAYYGTSGGQLRIHQGAILPASAKERWSRKFSRISHMAQVVLRDATISGFNDLIYGFMPNQVYRKTPQDFTVEGCTFEDGDGVIFGTATLRRCIFRNLSTAVMDYGGLNATFDECVFKGNGTNFHICFHLGVTCIDCEIDPSGRTGIFKSKDSSGKALYPRFVSKRRIQVKAVAADGQPAVGAKVAIRAEIPDSDTSVEPEFSDLRSAVTGEDGLTPAKALLLTEQSRQATDDPKTLRIVDYAYIITAEANGKRAETRGYKPKTGDVVIMAMK